MKQAIAKKGKVIPEEVPSPTVSDGSLLIKVMYSAISTGTEMAIVKSKSGGLIRKALKQPAKIIKALSMMTREGITSTIKKIKNHAGPGSTLGYSLSGIIIGIGKGVKTNFKIGDRVTAAGGGLATHSEYVDVPENLVCKIPDNLDFREASTVTFGSIALQAVRRANLKLGEFGVVFGIGIMGLLTVQLLMNSGVRVIGIDINDRRLALAEEYGAELVLNPQRDDIEKRVLNYTNGYGADAVIFAAVTSSNEPLSTSFNMCKKKGKVVLLGVSGMDIKRQDIYSKELDFLISTSYGPGRFDETYELKGIDYPYAFVRWTEKRNMQEYLRLLSISKINLSDMINAIYPIEKVEEAYISLNNEKRPLIVLLEYDKEIPDDLKEYINLKTYSTKLTFNKLKLIKNKQIINVALIGAGNFAKKTHLPNIQRLSNKFKLYAVVSRTGYNAKTIGEQYNAVFVSTNYDDVLNDENVDLLLIATRHNLHAELVLKALNAGKNVFVEKPLAMNEEELIKIEKFFEKRQNDKSPLLFVGFNRRFSKYAQEAKKYTSQRINPLFIHYRMNSGYVPLNRWVHTNEGGGRIIGDACQIIDLFTFFTESEIESISYESLTPKTDYFSSSDNKAIIIKYMDGSVAVLEYIAVGNEAYPEEYMEIHFDEKTIVIDDYKNIKGYGIKIKEISPSKSEKGHLEELEFLYDFLIGKIDSLSIELWDIFQTTRATFLISS